MLQPLPLHVQRSADSLPSGHSCDLDSWRGRSNLQDLLGALRYAALIVGATACVGFGIREVFAGVTVVLLKGWGFELCGVLVERRARCVVAVAEQSPRLTRDMA